MENIKQQVEKLNKKSKGADFWIGDDINLPVIQWTTQTITGLYNLEQIVSCPARKDHVLDLFLTIRPTLVNR